MSPPDSWAGEQSSGVAEPEAQAGSLECDYPTSGPCHPPLRRSEGRRPGLSADPPPHCPAQPAAHAGRPAGRPEPDACAQGTWPRARPKGQGPIWPLPGEGALQGEPGRAWTWPGTSTCVCTAFPGPEGCLASGGGGMGVGSGVPPIQLGPGRPLLWQVLWGHLEREGRSEFRRADLVLDTHGLSMAAEAMRP